MVPPSGNKSPACLNTWICHAVTLNHGVRKGCEWCNSSEDGQEEGVLLFYNLDLQKRNYFANTTQYQIETWFSFQGSISLHFSRFFFDFLTFDKHSYICLDICMYLCICNIYVYLCKYIHTSTYFFNGRTCHHTKRNLREIEKTEKQTQQRSNLNTCFSLLQVTSLKTNMAMETWTLWRCISYSKWQSLGVYMKLLLKNGIRDPCMIYISSFYSDFFRRQNTTKCARNPVPDFFWQSLGLTCDDPNINVCIHIYIYIYTYPPVISVEQNKHTHHWSSFPIA